jgi:PAP2 superfamily
VRNVERSVRAGNIDRLSSAVSIDPSGSTAAVSAAEVPPAAHPRTRWWVEVLVIVWLCWVYDAITELAPLRLHTALAHAHSMLALERSLHIDVELTLDRWLAVHHTLGLVVSDYYDNAHFVVTLGLLGWLWWKRSDIYRPLRNSLVLVNVIAFVVFWRFPVAPPRMLPGFTDVVAASGAFGSWHSGALASHANQLAAMPSLHIAWAVWSALVVWRISSRRWLRAIGTIYPFMTAFAVLSTGNHFVLDIAGGLVTISVSLLIVRLLEDPARRTAVAMLRRHPLLESPAHLTQGAGNQVRAACHKVVTKSKTR